MQKEDLVSVIIPTYNVEAYIKLALDSVLAQTYHNVEIIVVDDASRDRTVEIVKDYGSKVRSYYFTENRGAASVLNVGLEQARGDFILCFDADDVLAPHALASFLDVFFKNPELDFVYAPFFIFFQNPKELYEYNFPYPTHATFERLFMGNFLKLSQVMMRSEMIKKHHVRFDSSLRYGGDWDLWLQLTALGAKNVFCSEKLLYCLQRVTGQSGSSRGKFYAKKEALYLWQKWGKHLSDQQRAVVDIHNMAEKVRIKMLVNALGVVDSNGSKPLIGKEYESLVGKLSFGIFSLLHAIIPPKWFDNLAGHYYRRKEASKTFTMIKD